MVVAALTEGGCLKCLKESIRDYRSDLKVKAIKAKDDISILRWDCLDADGLEWNNAITIWWGDVEGEAKNETCGAECLRKFRRGVGP